MSIDAPVKVMVVGSGGREHALCWKLAQSPLVERIYCAPGNGGTRLEPKTENIELKVSDFAGIRAFAESKEIGLVVIGPDNPLADGIVDYLERGGLRVFGPRKAAAKLESSKAFAKRFMQRHNVPTARFVVVDSLKEAREAVAANPWIRVVKADGLALGKGVFVCDSREEVEDALKVLFTERRFGEAGRVAVLEERLVGEEVSLLMFCDGTRLLPMPACQDHKRRFEGDRGPNTGGMGAYAPVAVLERCRDAVRAEIIAPIERALRQKEIDFRGVLYAGLLLVEQAGSTKRELKPHVLEFNVRFGDPEAQVVLPLLESDLLEMLWACTQGRLNMVAPSWHRGAACTVVLCHEGYPESSSSHEEIHIGPVPSPAVVFHAGTTWKDNRVVTAGGRVLSVTARAGSLSAAVTSAYDAVSQVEFRGMAYRKDIAGRSLLGCR